MPEFQKQFASIFEHAPLAVCTIELPSMRYLYANESYSRVLPSQIAAKEIPGRTIYEVLGNPNPEALQAVFDAHERGKTTRFTTLKSSSMARAETYWAGAIMPLQKEAGRSVVLALLTEVTEPVLDERKKDDFIAIAVHELRTPLTGLKALTQTTLKHKDRFSVQELDHALEQIDRQATFLTRLIMDLMSTVKISSQRFEWTIGTCQLSEAFELAFDQFQFLHPERKLKLELLRISDDKIAIDQGRFVQVLLNILTNAAKYSEESSSIVLRTLESSNTIQIQIADQGIGLSADEIQKVFDRYYRATSGNTRGGLGLGLYVVREIITKAGGRIWAESHGTGKGTTFFIEIPKHGASL